jgi:ABC-type phosphate/phosphonate transport system ATPase subunit
VFGQAQAHALGRALPADAMRSAHIVLADLPADLFDPAAKRRLWHTLRGLRRALATSTAS